MTAHWEYFDRTQAGPAVIVVEEVKPGRSISVLHVSLYQGALLSVAPWISSASSTGAGEKSKKVVAGYITNRLLDAEQGITLSTQWTLPHPPPPVTDMAKLQLDQDPDWFSPQVQFTVRNRQYKHLEFYVPRKLGYNPVRSSMDLWCRHLNGEPFTPASLAYLIDSCQVLLIESYRPPSSSNNDNDDATGPDSNGGFTYDSRFWYPTLTMDLDVKKKLPPGGVQWLRQRVESKMIGSGRFDVEVLLFDEDGDLVALSHQVAMIVDFDRNKKGRDKASEKPKI